MQHFYFFIFFFFITAQNLSAQKTGSVSFYTSNDKKMAIIYKETSTSNGKIVSSDTIFDNTYKPIKKELYIVSIQGKKGLLHLPSGKLITPCRYYEISKVHEGFIRVEDFNSKSGFLNENGEIAIPLIYDGAEDFSEGVAPVAIDGKCGYINIKGKEVIPLKFRWITQFSEGMAWVKDFDSKNFKVIDRYGNYLFETGLNRPFGKFQNGLCIMVNPETNKVGLINTDGKMVVDFKYDAINTTKNSYLYIILSGENPYTRKKGLMNKDGVELLPAAYNFLESVDTEECTYRFTKDRNDSLHSKNFCN